MLADIRQKDADIRRKDADIRQVLADIRQKDAELREANAAKDRIVEVATRQERDLVFVNNKVLGLIGKRNTRGALEYVADREHGGKGGTQAGLSKLKDAKDFRAKVRHICKQHKLREQDVLKCLDNLYHTFSKEMHGLEVDNVCISFAHLNSAAERAALAAVFESRSVTYVCLDEQGNELLPSPYQCKCITACD